jgi:hypothetical protein
MSQNGDTSNQIPLGQLIVDGRTSASPPVDSVFTSAARLKGVSTVDFHITAKCSQACPYCWGPRRFRKPVDTGAA